jgi:hypothetical protein
MSDSEWIKIPVKKTPRPEEEENNIRYVLKPTRWKTVNKHPITLKGPGLPAGDFHYKFPNAPKSTFNYAHNIIPHALRFFIITIIVIRPDEDFYFEAFLRNGNDDVKKPFKFFRATYSGPKIKSDELFKVFRSKKEALEFLKNSFPYPDQIGHIYKVSLTPDKHDDVIGEVEFMSAWWKGEDNNFSERKGEFYEYEEDFFGPDNIIMKKYSK